MLLQIERDSKPWRIEKKADRLFRQALIFLGSTYFCIKAKTGGKHPQLIHCPHLCKLRAGRLVARTMVIVRKNKILDKYLFMFYNKLLTLFHFTKI